MMHLCFFSVGSPAPESRWPPLQVLNPIQEARMVVDAHPYMVNALAVCTATAEASAKLSAPMSDLMRHCLEDEAPPACSPLSADSTFRALYNGEIRMHQGDVCCHRCMEVTSQSADGCSPPILDTCILQHTGGKQSTNVGALRSMDRPLCAAQAAQC